MKGKATLEPHSHKLQPAAMTAADEAIADALREVCATAEAASNAAIHLNTQILNHRSNLASETAIVRDTATLLAHVVQNFKRTTAATLSKSGQPS